MYSTTRDRALAAAAATEHIETYGAPAGRINWSPILWVIFSVVMFAALVYLAGEALDVTHCRSVLAGLNGGSGHPEALRCDALING